MRGWIGVDLDGTLAEYHGWDGGNIGRPIPNMVRRVRWWIANHRDVRIFTARVAETLSRNEQGVVDDHAFAMDQRLRITAWCIENIGVVLPITATKDFGMIELWDDRCVHVEINTGRVIG